VSGVGVAEIRASDLVTLNAVLDDKSSFICSLSAGILKSM
jgi:hypothetical protein